MQCGFIQRQRQLLPSPSLPPQLQPCVPVPQQSHWLHAQAPIFHQPPPLFWVQHYPCTGWQRGRLPPHPHPPCSPPPQRQCSPSPSLDHWKVCSSHLQGLLNSPHSWRYPLAGEPPSPRRRRPPPAWGPQIRVALSQQLLAWLERILQVYCSHRLDASLGWMWRRGA